MNNHVTDHLFDGRCISDEPGQSGRPAAVALERKRRINSLADVIKVACVTGWPVKMLAKIISIARIG